ncbi:hypothetical protein [Planctomicrobium piriforme]|uniref:Uncharacterized protein n=1 Tax=Planctomicrobium piriforme TaxID=1576369 RepID=A0A1I3G333_9PLAN|nr:hypothetical protein [Planctomicrobium piriforme]SFI17880.1 hypothetical protein SAMN05421753_106155 [Planctomicrobium piriforme]
MGIQDLLLGDDVPLNLDLDAELQAGRLPTSPSEQISVEEFFVGTTHFTAVCPSCDRELLQQNFGRWTETAENAF